MSASGYDIGLTGMGGGKIRPCGGLFFGRQQKLHGFTGGQICFLGAGQQLDGQMLMQPLDTDQLHISENIQADQQLS